MLLMWLTLKRQAVLVHEFMTRLQDFMSSIWRQHEFTSKCRSEKHFNYLFYTAWHKHAVVKSHLNQHIVTRTTITIRILLMELSSDVGIQLILHISSEILNLSESHTSVKTLILSSHPHRHLLVTIGWVISHLLIHALCAVNAGWNIFKQWQYNLKSISTVS